MLEVRTSSLHPVASTSLNIHSDLVTRTVGRTIHKQTHKREAQLQDMYVWQFIFLYRFSQDVYL